MWSVRNTALDANTRTNNQTIVNGVWTPTKPNWFNKNDVENFTLSVTRDIRRNVNVDFRYIGTRGLKLNGNYNLNSPNVFYNAALFDALDRTRRGEDVLLWLCTKSGRRDDSPPWPRRG